MKKEKQSDLEVLRQELQQALTNASSYAHAIQVAQRGSVTPTLKTIIGSLNYLRKLADQ